MLRDRVVPALRTLGFKGSGRAFALPSDDYRALVGFQASSFSHRAAVRFTVNLTVASRAAWAEAQKKWSCLGEKPTVGVEYSVLAGDESVLWVGRIGGLLPLGLDYWWDVQAGSDTTNVADEVVAAIRYYALPAIRERMI